MEKTLAMKVLEGQKVPYEAVEYPSDVRDAAVIAGLFGVPPSQVFKTLVVARPPGAPRALKPVLALVPADRQLSLKKLAQAVKVKKLKMATHTEAEEMTGLQVGGISPLALLNKGFAVFIDLSAAAQEHVYISAGKRGVNLKLRAAELMRVIGARAADLCD